MSITSNTVALLAFMSSLTATLVQAQEPNTATMISANLPGPLDVEKNCPIGPYPKKAREAGMSGTAKLKLAIGANGKVESYELTRSSGWKLLDSMAIQAVDGCQAYPAGNYTPASKTISYNWNFTGSRDVQLKQDTCPESALVRLAQENEPGVGIVVGTYVNSMGITSQQALLQWGIGDASAEEEALRLAKSCQFKAAVAQGRTVGSGVSLRFFKK
ncbi:energy transducer TonB [Undibacterium curvum]|uniref:Energy transducer TonB n=1 Tax=Undibacterium curvum TaxID=2762294 RepID=A0ABR7A8X9_9BURK|nr:energy transducer TonB [Undibacterium curvum]MBC3933314.1 energy transducer TonB [Undibacterium curvum]